MGGDGDVISVGGEGRDPEVVGLLNQYVGAKIPRRKRNGKNHLRGLMHVHGSSYVIGYV